MTAPPIRSDHLLAVLGRDGTGAPAVLLLRDGAGWTLPRLTSDERASSDVAELARDAGAMLGAEVSVLQCLSDAPATGEWSRQQVYALEVQTERWTPPPDARWATAGDVALRTLAPAGAADAIAGWLGECRAGRFTARGRDWVRPGWRAEALSWVDGELASRGLGPATHVEQVKVWEYSHVLRLRAAGDDFYLKALCESSAREVGLTARLAHEHPGWVSDVVAADLGRRWLLMRATPGPELLQLGDTPAWEEAARRMARIQIRWVDRTAELVALGVPHWPLDVVAPEIARMLADEAALLAPCPEGLTGAEMAHLRGRAPELRELCAELAGLGVPDSLEHGDLWGSNVLLADGGPVLIDWEDATVAPPFVSPSLLLLTLPYSPAASVGPGLRERIRDAYLGEWQAAGPLRRWPAGRLERAFSLAQRAAMIHYAVQFWLGGPLIETSWWVRTFAPFFLRRCLG